MIFLETEIHGIYVVDLEPRNDERGFFARAFCAQEFAEHGLVGDVVQANLSANLRTGTTRGLHYQGPPHLEAKFFRSIRGETFNVAVDLRENSPTYGRWTGVVLSSENRRGFYVPPLCAAGYQALTDGAEVLYLSSAFYAPSAERGLRHDDPAIGIEWPLVPTALSERDRRWPLLERMPTA